MFFSFGPVSREAGFPYDTLSWTNICDEFVHVFGKIWYHDDLQREYTSTRDARESQPNGITDDNTVSGPALDVQVTLLYGKYCIVIKIKSLQIENTVSWLVISRGFDT